MSARQHQPRSFTAALGSVIYRYGCSLAAFRRGNDLLGRIPRDLGALTKLTHLDLSRNQLAGYAVVFQ